MVLELKVKEIHQGCHAKVDKLTEILKRYSEEEGMIYDLSNVAYIGDDLNDYMPMKLCGFAGCPADACDEIKFIADFVSPVKGGYGAVRDIIEHILTERGEWEEAIKKVYGIDELSKRC